MNIYLNYIASECTFTLRLCATPFFSGKCALCQHFPPTFSKVPEAAWAFSLHACIIQPFDWHVYPVHLGWGPILCKSFRWVLELSNLFLLVGLVDMCDLFIFSLNSVNNFSHWRTRQNSKVAALSALCCYLLCIFLKTEKQNHTTTF